MSQIDRSTGLVGNTGCKPPVLVATTAAITLSGEQTIDNIACVTGDRVLVWNQADSVDNGIYVVDTGAWSRSPDFDGTYDVAKGSFVYVTDGTLYAGHFFTLTTTDPVIGTSDLDFSVFFLGSSAASSFQQVGTGAVVRTTQAKLRELELSITDFGGDPTGVADCTAALILAMNQAFANADLDANVTIGLPDGTYLFTQDNPFGQWNAATPARRHVTFKGRGRVGSNIIFRPGGAVAAHLYDGETAAGGVGRAQQLLFVLFEKIGFEFDDTGMTGGTLNLVKQFPKAGAPNQNFQFRDCYFLGPATVARAGTVMFLRGAFNASENSFHNCRASGMKTIIDSTNNQAVNQYIFGCDWESMVGSIYIFNDGGGTLVHEGGSIIYGATLASSAYVLELTAGGGGLTTHFTIKGVKTELNSVFAQLVSMTGGNNGAIVTFEKTDHATTGGTGSRTIVSVAPQCPGTVLFDRCKMNPSSGGPFLYEFKAGTASYWLGVQYNAMIEFRDCFLPLDIHSRFSWGVNSNGLFRIRGGRQTSAWNQTDPNIAWDCDMLNVGWVHSPSSEGIKPKSVAGMIYYWPDATFNTDGPTNRTKLPPGSMIKTIKVKKRAVGGSASVYRLAVVNDDGTFCYGFLASFTSPNTFQQLLHEFTGQELDRFTGTGVDQYVRIIATKELAYNTQTANFTVGDTITDATTATTAKILADDDRGTTGVLRIGFITGGTGAFGVGNIITGAGGGSATAGATTSYQGAAEARTMDAGDVYAIEYY